MNQPLATVIVFPGSNGERDLAQALSAAGFAVELLGAERDIPTDCAVVGLPGGFSYGDYWRAGTLASQATAVRGLGKFVDGGGLAVGICNGFQILVEAGLLTGALRHNHVDGVPRPFVHKWMDVEVIATQVASPWFSQLQVGQRLRMPISHGEGCLFHPEGAAAMEGLIPLRYCENPNGSTADAAALIDISGRVLGLMPHPERAYDDVLGSADGLAMFQSAYAWCTQ